MTGLLSPFLYSLRHRSTGDIFKYRSAILIDYTSRTPYWKCLKLCVRAIHVFMRLGFADKATNSVTAVTHCPLLWSPAGGVGACGLKSSTMPLVVRKERYKPHHHSAALRRRPVSYSLCAFACPWILSLTGMICAFSSPCL
jgi:hypothetical protein